MFNPLSSSEVVLAVGRAARDAARNDEPASEFSRGQLMSAYSASRHLGVELASFGAELRAFSDEVAAAIRSAGNGALLPLADQLAAASSPDRIGELVCGVLEELDDDQAELRTTIQSALRRLSDREVELLADVIEGQRKR
jgi:hypothetical protein